MQEFTNWTVQTIREDKLIGSWMEERKFDWIPIVSKIISNVIEKNKSILIVTDDDREWFLKYCLNNLNVKCLAQEQAVYLNCSVSSLISMGGDIFS